MVWWVQVSWKQGQAGWNKLWSFLYSPAPHTEAFADQELQNCRLQRSNFMVLRVFQSISSLNIRCRPTVKFRGQFVQHRAIPELALRLVTMGRAASRLVWALTTSNRIEESLYSRQAVRTCTLAPGSLVNLCRFTSLEVSYLKTKRQNYKSTLTHRIVIKTQRQCFNLSESRIFVHQKVKYIFQTPENQVFFYRLRDYVQVLKVINSRESLQGPGIWFSNKHPIEYKASVETRL